VGDEYRDVGNDSVHVGDNQGDMEMIKFTWEIIVDMCNTLMKL
jgi:hypothetical protein